MRAWLHLSAAPVREMRRLHRDSAGAGLTMESNSSGNLTRAMAEAGSVLPGYLAVILSVLMVTLVVVVVAGNALVIMAFVVDKTLRNQSNYFFLNLAISDFLVGELPPFSFIMSPWQGAKMWLLFLLVNEATPSPTLPTVGLFPPPQNTRCRPCSESVVGPGGAQPFLPPRPLCVVRHTHSAANLGSTL